MPKKLNNWSYETVTDFIKEPGLRFFEDLDGRHVWIKLQAGGEPDRIVELRFKGGKSAEKTMKSIIRQSGIVESEWIKWTRPSIYPCVVFRVGDDDAKKLADGFSYFEAKDLRNLEAGQVIYRVDRSDSDFNLSVPLPETVDTTAAEARCAEAAYAPFSEDLVQLFEAEN